MCTVQEFMDAYIGPDFTGIQFFSANEGLTNIALLPTVDKPLDLYGTKKVMYFSVSPEHKLRLYIK